MENRFFWFKLVHNFSVRHIGYTFVIAISHLAIAKKLVIFAQDSGDEFNSYSRQRPRITVINAKDVLTAVSCLSKSPN